MGESLGRRWVSKVVLAAAGFCCAAAVLPSWAVEGIGASARPVAAAAAPTADFQGKAASADARYVADWVMEAQDHQGLPFAVVDKKDAKIFVFDANGRLRGASAALMGLAIGDRSVPGLNKRDLSRLLPQERTTPAGRFVSEPGRNLQGEQVVWVDYEAAFAIHRLRPAAPQERRPQRLASATPEDNRISLGCVVVPVAFYESVVANVLGRSRAVVYVLPETRPVRDVFGWQ